MINFPKRDDHTLHRLHSGCLGVYCCLQVCRLIYVADYLATGNLSELQSCEKGPHLMSMQSRCLSQPSFPLKKKIEQKKNIIVRQGLMG